jgi:hypothetical protein
MKFIEAPQDLYAHSLSDQIRRVIGDSRVKQGEERLDLSPSALPVLAAEGEDGQAAHAALLSALHDGPDGVDTGGVALRLGHASLTGPAAIAVHDDGHVARHELLDRCLGSFA